MILIALGHKARHGKDTFAASCREAYGRELDIRLMSFADPLRQEVREAAQELFAKVHPTTHFDGNEAMRLLCERDGIEFDEHAIPDEDYPWGKQRVYHQWYGTEFRRAQDPEYWTKRGVERIEAARREGAFATFFRDLRFPNEYDLTGFLEGWRIKVSRLGYKSGVPEHISETALDNHEFDFRLGIKDGHLSMLQEMSVEMFKRIAKL